MARPSQPTRTLSNMLAARIVPHRFLAAQLRRPSGRIGRWVMTRGLNAGNQELIDAALGALELQASDVFLDMGFGGGYALARAATLTQGGLWGVDFSPDMVLAARGSLRALLAAGRLNLLSADVAELPLRDGLFDAVCTTNTVYFWTDLQRALAELRRVTKPGGRIAIGYSGRAKMQRFDGITKHGFRMLQPQELARELVAAGWTEVTTSALEGKVTKGDYVTVARA